MTEDVLYRRPKQSEMMMGISDMIRMLSLEIDKMAKFGYVMDYNSMIIPDIKRIEGNLFYWDQSASELRKKGL